MQKKQIYKNKLNRQVREKMINLSLLYDSYSTKKQKENKELYFKPNWKKKKDCACNKFVKCKKPKQGDEEAYNLTRATLLYEYR
jgi:hypothetical protein